MASTLRGYLLALAAPKHRAAVDGRTPAYGAVATSQRMGQALAELVERHPSDHLPSAGGVTARLVVTLVPPGLCQVHQDDPWSRGGRTTVHDGRLLVSRT